MSSAEQTPVKATGLSRGEMTHDWDRGNLGSARRQGSRCGKAGCVNGGHLSHTTAKRGDSVERVGQGQRRAGDMQCCFPAGSDSPGSARTKGPSHRRAPLSVPRLSRAQAGTREHVPGPTQGAPWSTRTHVHQVRWGRGTPACSWAGTHVAMYLASPKEPVGCCSFGVSILGGQSPKLISWAKAAGPGAFSPSQCPKNISWDVAAFIIDEDK